MLGTTTDGVSWLSFHRTHWSNIPRRWKKGFLWFVSWIADRQKKIWRERERERIQNFNVHRSFSVCCICYWHSLYTCTCSTFIWHSMGKVKLLWTAMFTWVRKVRKLMTPIPTINKVHINILSSCSDVLVMANVWNGGSSISNLTLQHVTFVDLINTYTEQWHRLIMKISFS